MEAPNQEIKEMLKNALFKQAKYSDLTSELGKEWYREETAKVELLKQVFKALHGKDAEAIIKNIYEEGEREFNSQ